MTAAEKLAAVLAQQPEPITPVAPTAPPGLLDAARQWVERRGQGLLNAMEPGQGLLQYTGMNPDHVRTWQRNMLPQATANLSAVAYDPFPTEVGIDLYDPRGWKPDPNRNEAEQRGDFDARRRDIASKFAFALGVLPMGSIGGRTGLPDKPPSGLRERYDSLLYQASGGKDPSRIKLTPERVDAAKGLLEQQIRNRQGFLGDNPYRQTTQMQQAISFAEQAKRAGHDVALKTPDGPFGSIYVRVGDKGTVRFADHAQPTTPTGEPTGGYSKTLGRRHYPATMSVSRGDSTLDEAMKWLLGD